MKKNLHIALGLLLTSALPKTTHGWNSVFGTVTTYEQWMSELWKWALVIVVPLSTLMIAFAGFLWMTSSGDPTKIGTAKKIITGVVSGLLLLILARVFLVNVIGLQGGVWNITP